MTIYLIRHGRTAANDAHLYCGSTDLPLSPSGREDLAALHYDIKNVRFRTSGMRRTDETLELLFAPVDFLPDPRFRELDFGVFEMKSYAELRDDTAYQVWISGNNEANVPPGGESGLAMRQRVLTAFAELQEDTVLITHGGVIAVILAHCFPDAKKNRYQWQPAPGQGYRLDFDGQWHCRPL